MLGGLPHIEPCLLHSRSGVYPTMTVRALCHIVTIRKKKKGALKKIKIIRGIKCAFLKVDRTFRLLPPAPVSTALPESTSSMGCLLCISLHPQQCAVGHGDSTAMGRALGWSVVSIMAARDWMSFHPSLGLSQVPHFLCWNAWSLAISVVSAMLHFKLTHTVLAV